MVQQRVSELPDQSPRAVLYAIAVLRQFGGRAFVTEACWVFWRGAVSSIKLHEKTLYDKAACTIPTVIWCSSFVDGRCPAIC
jgi:hypothetical protein